MSKYRLTPTKAMELYEDEMANLLASVEDEIELAWKAYEDEFNFHMLRKEMEMEFMFQMLEEEQKMERTCCYAEDDDCHVEFSDHKSWTVSYDSDVSCEDVICEMEDTDIDVLVIKSCVRGTRRDQFGAAKQRVRRIAIIANLAYRKDSYDDMMNVSFCKSRGVKGEKRRMPKSLSAKNESLMKKAKKLGLGVYTA